MFSTLILSLALLTNSFSAQNAPAAAVTVTPAQPLKYYFINEKPATAEAFDTADVSALAVRYTDNAVEYRAFTSDCRFVLFDGNSKKALTPMEFSRIYTPETYEIDILDPVDGIRLVIIHKKK